MSTKKTTSKKIDKTPKAARSLAADIKRNNRSKTKAASKKPNAIHEALVKLMTRPNGASLADIGAAKFKAPAIQALRLVERRGYKTSVKKVAGELTRYIAKRAGGGS